jgi:RimJ/RimL family protein N-acetyltransferase
MDVVQEGTAKDGTEFLIRYPETGDVESVWKYINRLSKERTFIRFQGEEIPIEKEEEYIAKRMREIQEGKDVTLFLVVDGEVQGISGIEMQDRTESHIGVFGLSIDASVRGKGLGETLMRAVMEESKKLKGLKIITLKVKAPNEVAIALYTKLGFVEHGRLPLGTQHQGAFIDEAMMYKTV